MDGNATTINQQLSFEQMCELLGAAMNAVGKPHNENNIYSGRPKGGRRVQDKTSDDALPKPTIASDQTADKKRLPPATGSSQKAQQ